MRKFKRNFYMIYIALCTFMFDMTVYAKKSNAYKSCEDIFGKITDKTSTIYFLQQIFFFHLYL